MNVRTIMNVRTMKNTAEKAPEPGFAERAPLAVRGVAGRAHAPNERYDRELPT